METGLIPAILNKQHPEGYWENNKGIYGPKYFSTVWQVIMLAQLGADPSDPQIQKACEFLLQNGIQKFGGFSVYSSQTGAVHCLQGNSAAALLDFGYRDDPRLMRAMDWMARSVTGEGFDPVGVKSTGDHYILSGISAPGFTCGAKITTLCMGSSEGCSGTFKVPGRTHTF
jgi:hypothetical protein